jgi:hypothetical protein
MALTELQRGICRLIAANRIAGGESYVAGGVALTELLGTSRLSRDIDLFHDSEEALDRTWRADRDLLVSHGYEVVVVRERPSHVLAEVWQGAERILAEWARDSAYRFFPLVEHAELGLTLHPFDLATNKVLALVGRVEARDWVDVIECDARLQPFGYLAWAACGKDPGFSPAGILAEARRTSRYSVDEVRQLAFSGPPPDAADLARRWTALLAAAAQVHDLLPPEEVGKCVLSSAGDLFRGGPDELRAALADARLRFHAGRIRGAYPQTRPVGGP